MSILVFHNAIDMFPNGIVQFVNEYLKEREKHAL